MQARQIRALCSSVNCSEEIRRIGGKPSRSCRLCRLVSSAKVRSRSQSPRLTRSRKVLEMLQLGTITYNIAKDWDLDTILKKLDALKFEGVELRTGHRH